MVCKISFANWNAQIALLGASMVVTYYIKIFRTGVDRRNGILMSLLLLVAETIKIRELPPFGKFVTEVLIFRGSRSQIFFKIGALKNFAIFTRKHLCWPLQSFFYRTSTVAASKLLRQQILFFSWIWYLLSIVTPVFAPKSFGNTS